MRYVSKEYLDDAKKALDRGDILAIPTDTSYSLAVKLDNVSAIRKLLDLSSRQLNGNKIFTLMVADVDDIKKYAVLSRKKLNMARHYFPGELTLILPKRQSFKNPYFDNFETVGIRIPNHQYTLSLLRNSGPLLVVSAQPQESAPCYTSKEVVSKLPKIDTVVEGRSDGNLPPTVIDWTEEEPEPIRQGGLLIVRYS